MQKQSLFFVAALFLLLASCTVTKTNTVKTRDIIGDLQYNGVTHITVMTDLDVKDTRVTGIAIGLSAKVEQLKVDAAANAIDKTGADILIEPRYKTETKNGKTTVTATGYPATYKNFRAITKKDIDMLDWSDDANKEYKQTDIYYKVDKK